MSNEIKDTNTFLPYRDMMLVKDIDLLTRNCYSYSITTFKRDSRDKEQWIVIGFLYRELCGRKFPIKENKLYDITIIPSFLDTNAKDGFYVHFSTTGYKYLRKFRIEYINLKQFFEVWEIPRRRILKEKVGYI